MFTDIFSCICMIRHVSKHLLHFISEKNWANWAKILKKNVTHCAFKKNSEWKVTYLWVFLHFCMVLGCNIIWLAKIESFPKRFLNNLQNKKKLDPFSMQILLSCIDSFFGSILLIYAKFPFIWYVTLYS